VIQAKDNLMVSWKANLVMGIRRRCNDTQMHYDTKVDFLIVWNETVRLGKFLQQSKATKGDPLKLHWNCANCDQLVNTYLIERETSLNSHALN
jgi:hypothetical protein